MHRYTFSCLQFFFLLATSFAQKNVDTNCTTPAGLPGSCISIRECAPLLQILFNYPSAPDSGDFLKKSQCGVSTTQPNDPKVCCPNATSRQTTVRPSDPNLTVEKNPFLPLDCGADLSSRIFGGENTELSEFPWMALLEYSRGDEKTTACGGVLINERYVLTAAHCLRTDISPPNWQLSAVRLGEYDTRSDRDCVQDNADTLQCTDAPTVVAIEETIPHELYISTSRDYTHDIALLRLSQEVNFTDYIKPICLPNSLDLDSNFWVAGWGMTENSTHSNLKLKLSIPLSDHNDCIQKYKRLRINVGESQLCAGGQRGKDTCQGDSGGPLMSSETLPDGTAKWTVVGVVSVGPSQCGLKDWPGIYTKVIDYVPWILSKIRA